MEVGQVVLSKKQAVEQEDYDTACNLKVCGRSTHMFIHFNLTKLFLFFFFLFSSQMKIDQMRISAFKSIPDYPGKDNTELDSLISYTQQESNYKKKDMKNDSDYLGSSRSLPSKTDDVIISSNGDSKPPTARRTVTPRDEPSSTNQVPSQTKLLSYDDRPLPIFSKKPIVDNPFNDDATNGEQQLPSDKTNNTKTEKNHYEPSKEAHQKRKKQASIQQEKEEEKVVEEAVSEFSLLLSFFF